VAPQKQVQDGGSVGQRAGNGEGKLITNLKGKMYERDERLYRVVAVQEDVSNAGTVYVSQILTQRQYVNEIGALCWGHARWILYSNDIQRRINQYECQLETGGAA
jgi:hypothetical protein